jgi:lactobin A/cerein 7B family class IIb bacteriocin
MAEQTLFISRNAVNYSTGLVKLINDISNEMTTGIRDGLASRLGGVENDEAKLYAFIKNEGYPISYKEFTSFLVDAKEMVQQNEAFIRGAAADQTAESRSEELSDQDLEQVAGGGLPWWAWLLIAAAALLVVAACLVCPVLIGVVGAGLGAAVAGGLGAGLTIGVVAGAALASTSVVIATGAAVAVAGAVVAGVAVVAGAAGGIGAAVS